MLTPVAPSVAELAEMPLYSVTCGDIGTKPEEVENYLQTVLMLGKRWNCRKWPTSVASVLLGAIILTTTEF